MNKEYFDNLKNQMGLDGTTHDNSTSDFYKFVEGDNRVRVLSPFQMVAEVFVDKTPMGFLKDGQQVTENMKVSKKAWAWAHIVNTDEVKIIKVGNKILAPIIAFQSDKDYAYDAFPMPYEISIKAEGAGNMDVVYTVIPRPRSDVSEAVLAQFNKKTPISDIVARISAKREAAKTPVTQETPSKMPEYPVNDGKIAF